MENKESAGTLHMLGDIREWISSMKDNVLALSKEHTEHTDTFFYLYHYLLDRFEKELDTIRDMHVPGEYTVELSAKGIVLLLHYGEEKQIELLRVDSLYLPIEKYAETYHVEVEQVETWLKQCLIKDARETAVGWMINSLQDIPLQETLQNAVYVWDPLHSQPFTGYRYLKGYTGASFTGNRDTDTVILLSEGKQKKTIMTREKRLRLEYYCISRCDMEYIPAEDCGLNRSYKFHTGE